MCRTRKTMVISARLRCSPVVRKRGQSGPCTRCVERTPRITTALSRTRVTAPAPRVVYQRRLFDTSQCEAPETACAVPPDDEVTPLDDCRLLDELDVVVDVDVEDVPAEVDELAVAVVDEAEVPGIVSALTAPSAPTPPAATKAATNVRRFSSRRAASRARARVSMAPSLVPAAKPHL